MEEIKNAKIESTMLGLEDHGIMTFFIHLDYGHSGQGFGGISLDGSPTEGFSAIKIIREILKVVGVDKWEDLKGKHVRVKSDYTKVYEIGHFLEDKWYKI